MNKSIVKILFPGIDNAYVIISGSKTDSTGNGCRKNMTFFYDGGDGVGVEWEPDNGPITVIYKCDEEHEEAVPCPYYGYSTGRGNWSQIGVDNSNLAHYFVSGHYVALFNALADWL